jgi:hypothetical protein
MHTRACLGLVGFGLFGSASCAAESAGRQNAPSPAVPAQTPEKAPPARPVSPATAHSAPTPETTVTPPPSAVPSPDAGPPPVPSELALSFWNKIGESKNGCPKEFDYFPQGGLRNFACHVAPLVPYPALRQKSGLNLFVSGPHSNVRLVLNSRKSFGHYNPEFVRWAADHLIPGAHDEVFRTATQSTYDRYVQPLARTFFATYRKIEREPDCFEREKQRYVELLAKGALPEGYYYNRWFSFMDDQFCRKNDAPGIMMSTQGFAMGAYDGNVVNTCVAFWVRRSIDRTMPEFYRGLAKLLRAYDRELYRRGESVQ